MDLTRSFGGWAVIPAEKASPLNVWSASLPLGWAPSGNTPYVYLIGLAPEAVRPWNGRRLTAREIDGCRRAFLREYDETCSVGSAAQAAYEYLSAECW